MMSQRLKTKDGRDELLRTEVISDCEEAPVITVKSSIVCSIPQT